MKNPKGRFAVEVGGTWYETKSHNEVKNGWLDYELHGGTRGLVQAGKWKPVAQLKAQGIKVEKES